MKNAIEQELQDLFIADSRLDEVKVFFIGEPPIIRDNDYPASVIFVEQQIPSDEETGIWVYTYSGYLAAETLIIDRYEVKNRRSTMISFLTMRDILDSMTDIAEENLALGNIISGNETTRVIKIGLKTYGFKERSNNILNRGEVPFEVQTQKPRA